MSNRRHFIKATIVAAALASMGMSAHAADTIKVGILHSLSGTMAISETALKETALMTIEEINKAGGVMGKQLEPVVVDPASNWPLFAEKARQLLTKDKVAVTFGCWTSVSRKSVLPVFEELNGIYYGREKQAYALLDALGCKYREHQAGLFVWAELPESYEGDSFAFSDEVMDKCDVFLTPGGIFGSEGNRYIRITLCCPEELLKKATDNIIAKFGK